MYGYGFLSRR